MASTGFERDSCMSVMTVNMYGSSIAWESRLDALSSEIRYWRPNVLCLQEVRFFDKTSTARKLAKATNMRLVKETSIIMPGHDDPHGTAILISDDVKIISESSLILPAPESKIGGATLTRAVLQTSSGRIWQIGTTHLDWGSHAESLRMSHMQEIVGHMQNPSMKDYVTVLAGDFNSLPTSPTVRYLTGEHIGEPATLWVDAWNVAGDGDGYTSHPANQWAAATAAEVGIPQPRLVPPRRIDYVMVQGFVHGRPGYPVHAYLTGVSKSSKITPSDHYGVWVDLWDPPVHSEVHGRRVEDRGIVS